MSRTRCFVQLVDGKIVRIFKGRPTTEDWVNLTILEYPKKDAVAEIRRQVFERANDLCQKCGAKATEMHEKVLRSLGGCYSLENCEALCNWCHQSGPDAEHANRRPRWSK